MKKLLLSLAIVTAFAATPAHADNRLKPNISIQELSEVSGSSVAATDFALHFDTSANDWVKSDPTDVNIDSGTIDGVTLGGSSAGAGSFTTLTTSGAATIGGDATFSDDIELILGTSSDLSIEYNSTDAIVTSGPATGLWADAPSVLDPDPAKFYKIEDDFMNPASATASDVQAFTEIDDAATGTNAFQDAAGGIYNVVTAAADNDYHAMSSVAENFLFASGKKAWCEARFKVAEATTNESAWWFGLTDTLTTGGFQADAGGPLASYDGALIWKDEATMAVDFETSNAGTQATTTAIATAVTNTWTRVGFYFDGTATTSTITPYVAVNDSNTLTAGTAQNITLAGLEEMHLVFGIKAGPTAAAETLQVDYVKCLQLR